MEHAHHIGALEEECKRKIEESKTQEESLQTSFMEMHDMKVQRVQARLEEMEVEQRTVLA